VAAHTDLKHLKSKQDFNLAVTATLLGGPERCTVLQRETVDPEWGQKLWFDAPAEDPEAEDDLSLTFRLQERTLLPIYDYRETIGECELPTLTQTPSPGSLDLGELLFLQKIPLKPSSFIQYKILRSRIEPSRRWITVSHLVSNLFRDASAIHTSHAHSPPKRDRCFFLLYHPLYFAFLGTLYSVSRWGRLSHESSTRIKAFTCSTHGGYTGLLRRGIVPQFQRFRSFAMIVERISPEEAHRRKQCGECDLHLDVRTPEEYQEVHAPDSLLVPYMLKQGDKMVPNPNFLSEVEKLTGGNLERKLIVNCASGRRSAMAAEELSKKGYKVIADMEGGIQQYLQKPHLPVNRPKSQ